MFLIILKIDKVAIESEVGRLSLRNTEATTRVRMKVVRLIKFILL